MLVAGRGIGDETSIKGLKRLSGLIGGVVGATRPVCDMGLLPHSAQIGQTGHIISPNVYMGFGVSGAAPHTIGIQGAKVMIGINTDKDAPIFDFVNYGFIADAKEVISSLIKRLEAKK